MEFKMIKLITGEVVLGKLKEESNGDIVLDKPVTIILDPIQGGVGMVPYDAIYTQIEQEEKMFIKEQIFDNNMSIHSSFEEAYLKQTTGLETAAPKIEV